MKILKYTGNPYAFISLYLLLLFEGEHFGGFYLLYLLLALPHGADYASLSIAGILLLAIGFHSGKIVLRSIMMLLGLLLMITAIIVFINKGNVGETFSLALPVITFVLCGISCLSMIINEILTYRHSGFANS